MELIDRKYRILQAIIDDYILTALPVGSRTISRKYEQKLSSATIRNEMSDLEELGYLDSPHTSAGRIPSYKSLSAVCRSDDSSDAAEQGRKHIHQKLLGPQNRSGGGAERENRQGALEHDALYDRRADKGRRGRKCQPLAAGADFGQTAAAGAW